jgi:hypothetical protein
MPATRLMRLWTILAVLLAPLGMIGAAPAHATIVHPGHATADQVAMPGMEQ